MSVRRIEDTLDGAATHDEAPEPDDEDTYAFQIRESRMARRDQNRCRGPVGVPAGKTGRGPEL
jgi:hypothetical protein